MREFFPKREDGFDLLINESEVEAFKPLQMTNSFTDTMNLDFDEFLCF